MKKFIAGTIFGLILTMSFGVYAAPQLIAKYVDFDILVNGQKAELNAQPVLIDGSTYLPLRTTANILGYNVTFKSDRRTIELNNETTNIGDQSPNDQNEQILTNKYTHDGITARELLDVLSKKHDPYSISISDKNVLRIYDDVFTLDDFVTDHKGIRYYNIDSLIEAGILTRNDI